MFSKLGFVVSFSKAFLLFVSATFSFEICSMSMYALDVGPGNFTLFKYENRAFIVDCGTYRSDISSYANSKEFRKTVTDTLSGIDHVKIAVTHAHVDHYGLIKSLFCSDEAVCSKDKIDGILVCARNPIIALKSLPVTFVTNISDAIYNKDYGLLAKLDGKAKRRKV